MKPEETEEKSNGCEPADSASAEPEVIAAEGETPAEAPTEAPDDPPVDELAQLRQQLEAAQHEARDNYDRFVRERAELENFKRRMQRDKNEALKFASESLLRDLLPIVDNLERAVAHAPEGAGNVVEGVRYVLSGMIDAMAKHGVSRIDAAGQPFDPTLHEAMMRVESADLEPNTVVEQFASGYRLHDRLLRPAMVSVSAQKNEAAVETPKDSD